MLYFIYSMYFKTDVAEGWKCSAMKAEYTGTLGGGSLKSQDFNISCDALNAPITTVSYSCGNSTFKSMNGTKTLATLVLGHFQVKHVTFFFEFAYLHSLRGGF